MIARVTRRPCLAGDAARGHVAPRQRLARGVQRRLVPLDGGHIVTARLDEELGGVGPGMHGVHGHRHAFEAEPGEQGAGRGDLVAFRRNGELPEDSAGVVVERSDQVRCRRDRQRQRHRECGRRGRSCRRWRSRVAGQPPPCGPTPTPPGSCRTGRRPGGRTPAGSLTPRVDDRAGCPMLQGDSRRRQPATARLRRTTWRRLRPLGQQSQQHRRGRVAGRPGQCARMALTGVVLGWARIRHLHPSHKDHTSHARHTGFAPANAQVTGPCRPTMPRPWPGRGVRSSRRSTAQASPNSALSQLPQVAVFSGTCPQPKIVTGHIPQGLVVHLAPTRIHCDTYESHVPTIGP